MANVWKCLRFGRRYNELYRLRIKDRLPCSDALIEEFRLNARHRSAYEWLDKQEVINEMRNDPAMRGQRIDTSRRKILLVIV